MGKELALTTLVLSFLFGLSVVAGENGDSTLTQVSTPRAPSPIPPFSEPQHYPEYLICEAVPDNPGPSWHSITIGSSSLDDLQSHLMGLGKYRIVYKNGSELTIQRYDISWEQYRANASTSPYTLQVCVTDDNTISVLGLPYLFESRLTLYDLLAVYGMPDAVTWMARPLSRHVYWLREGVSATIYMGPEDDFRFVTEAIYYFPYLNIEEGEFEATWPIKFVRQTVGPIPSPYEQEQNPFDFDTMIATITIEPSPTPTFAPINLTAAATP